jgi:hypothetical protein
MKTEISSGCVLSASSNKCINFITVHYKTKASLFTRAVTGFDEKHEALTATAY